MTRPERLESSDSSPPVVHVSNGMLAATFAKALFDHGVRMCHDSHLIKMAKEPKLRLNPKDGTKRGIGDGDIVRLNANGSTITAKIKWDERVAENTLVIPLGFEKEIPVHDLGTNLMNGLSVEISREK